MKFVTYTHGGTREKLGLMDGLGVIDLHQASGGADCFIDMVALITSGDEGLARAQNCLDVAENGTVGRPIPLAGIRLQAPMRPSTILCSGSNYWEHNAEKAASPLSGREPEFFIKTADCVVGPEEPIIYDEKLSTKLDCETELAVVIGKPGRHIAVEDALDHVFGYTIVNDVTARDRQVRRSPEGFTWYELGRGKAFDSSAPLGPAIATSDEVGDPQALALSTRINGELRQASSTSAMIWSCAELIHFFSINFTLKPGMVIITGTPAGTSWSVDKELGGTWTPSAGLIAATRYCLPGDIIESEIEKIGLLRTVVVAG